MSLRKIFIKIYKNIVYILLKPLLIKEYNFQREILNERPVEYAFVLKHISKIYPKKILDVGPGKSSLPHLLYNCGFHVTAIDEMKSCWKENVDNRHFWIFKDNITNPQIKGSFDLITCISTLEHIAEHKKAIKNMFALLKNGGYLILSFPYNEKKYIYNIYDSPEAGYGKSNPYICQIFSRNEIESWLDENNGVLIDQEYYKVFTGKYWTYGKRLNVPQKVSKKKKHHLTALIIKKSG
ncbi:tRNA 5-carboxymethoxyuridine methyltransferase [subsurface metagenome]|nr:methyltransferase domain-containing protein [Clostridia bacterium]